MLKMMSDMFDRMVGEVTNMVGEINSKVGDLTQTVNSHSQSISKLEAQVGQIANTLNRREEQKLPSQPVVNPKGIFMVEGSTSHLE
jgi:peptidoglycan hydrolase CwlO-like protein